MNKYQELNTKTLRRYLNGFFQSNFLNDRDNLEALRFAIQVEDMILSSGYRIEYSITNDGRIQRANKILPNPSQMKQEVTIKKNFGHLLPKEEAKEVVKDKDYFKGKLAFNERTLDVGIITGYNPGNNRDIMRFSVIYAKSVPEVGEDFLVRGTTAWNESACSVFNDRYDMYEHVENTRSSLINDVNIITDELEKRLNFLHYND